MSKLLKGNCVSVEAPSAICYEAPPAGETPACRPLRPDAGGEPEKGPSAETAPDVGEAKRLLEEAGREAKKIVKTAGEEAEEIYKSAYQNGYNDGVKAGGEKCLKHEKRLADEFRVLAERLSADREKTENAAYDEALNLAFVMASKIVDIEIDQNDEAFFNICSKAALHAGEATKAVLKVGPREYVIASRYENEIKKCLGGLEDFEIELDETAKTTECVIETDSGMVDASVDAQLGRARELIQMSR